MQTQVHNLVRYWLKHRCSYNQLKQATDLAKIADRTLPKLSEMDFAEMGLIYDGQLHMRLSILFSVLIIIRYIAVTDSIGLNIIAYHLKQAWIGDYDVWPTDKLTQDAILGNLSKLENYL